MIEKRTYKKIDYNYDYLKECPDCGSSDITFDIGFQKLQCSSCRRLIEPKKLSIFDTPISELNDFFITLGTNDVLYERQPLTSTICSGCGAKFTRNNNLSHGRCPWCRTPLNKDFSVNNNRDYSSLQDNSLVTLACHGCNAEVIVNTNETVNARCHWCRTHLSIDDKVENGSFADAILPFRVTRKEAVESIAKFMEDKQTFASTKFKKQFNSEDIFGVFLPYVFVDINGHYELVGEGEIQSKVTGTDSNKKYEADLYSFNRSFGFEINDLTVEANSERFNFAKNSNDIINAILPFDLENSLIFNPHYMKGFSSEKRDLNIDSISPLINNQVEDIARYNVPGTSFFDRGIRISAEKLEIKGERWVSVYLPVWMYSYKEELGGKVYNIIVNGRTKETRGRVPTSDFFFLFTLFLCCLLLFWPGAPFFGFCVEEIKIRINKSDSIYRHLRWLYIIIPIIFDLLLISIPFTIWGHYESKYGGDNERHSHESKSDFKMRNPTGENKFLWDLTNLSQDRIENESILGLKGNRK